MRTPIAQETAAESIVRIIEAHESHVVVLGMDSLGKEELLLHLHNTLGDTLVRESFSLCSRVRLLGWAVETDRPYAIAFAFPRTLAHTHTREGVECEREGLRASQLCLQVLIPLEVLTLSPSRRRT